MPQERVSFFEATRIQGTPSGDTQFEALHLSKGRALACITGCAPCPFRNWGTSNMTYILDEFWGPSGFSAAGQPRSRAWKIASLGSSGSQEERVPGSPAVAGGLGPGSAFFRLERLVFRWNYPFWMAKGNQTRVLFNKWRHVICHFLSSWALRNASRVGARWSSLTTITVS